MTTWAGFRAALLARVQEILPEPSQAYWKDGPQPFKAYAPGVDVILNISGRSGKDWGDRRRVPDEQDPTFLRETDYGFRGVTVTVVVESRSQEDSEVAINAAEYLDTLIGSLSEEISFKTASDIQDVSYTQDERQVSACTVDWQFNVLITQPIPGSIGTVAAADVTTQLHKATGDSPVPGPLNSAQLIDARNA
jgi:hypothetical protein